MCQGIDDTTSCKNNEICIEKIFKKKNAEGAFEEISKFFCVN